jgi:pimeloyl-ACP methyl ester carboxylesterase
VIAGVADKLPSRIRAIVYLDAFLLENGESLMDIVPPGIAQVIREQAQATDEGWSLNPIPAHLLGVRDPHEAAWVDAQCTPQAIATFEERITLTNGPDLIQDIAYIFPTECHPNLLASHRRAKAKGWNSHTLDNSGHELMIDAPQRLAEVLLKYSRTE